MAAQLTRFRNRNAIKLTHLKRSFKMIRIKIYNIIYNLPNFLLLVTNERKSKREWGEKDTKKIEDYEDSNFLKNIIIFETQGGLGGLSRRGPLLSPPGSVLPFLPWPWVHDSRVTRELSHVTRSLSPCPLPPLPMCPHRRPTPACTGGAFVHARSYYGAVRCRAVA